MMYPTKYRILDYKLKCKECGKTIHAEKNQVWEYKSWWDFRRKREKLPRTIKQKDHAVCEKCVKSNNGLIVEEDFCMIKWLNSDIAKDSVVTTRNICHGVKERKDENKALEEKADEIFLNFKKEAKIILSVRGMRSFAPDAWKEIETGIYSDREELKLAIEKYLDKTKDIWMDCYTELLKDTVESEFEEFRVLSEEVVDFLKNNKQRIYTEYFFKDTNYLKKKPFAKAYEEIDSDITKAQKRISNVEKKADKIMELCVNRLNSKQFFRYMSKVITKNVFEEIKLQIN